MAGTIGILWPVILAENGFFAKVSHIKRPAKWVKNELEKNKKIWWHQINQASSYHSYIEISPMWVLVIYLFLILTNYFFIAISDVLLLYYL